MRWSVTYKRHGRIGTLVWNWRGKAAENKGLGKKPAYTMNVNIYMPQIYRGRDSSVGIATCYGLDGPGIESWWRCTRTRPDLPWGPPSLLYNGYRVFPGGEAAGAWCWPHHPHLQCRGLKKGRAIPLSTVRALVACIWRTFLRCIAARTWTGLKWLWMRTVRGVLWKRLWNLFS